MKFSEKLFELRRQKGMSQEDLADKLNVSRQTISKWETGSTTPEMEKLIEMSKLFEITIDELVGNDWQNKKENETNEEKKEENNTSKIAEESEESLGEESPSKQDSSKENYSKPKQKKKHILLKIIFVIALIYALISIYKYIAMTVIINKGQSACKEDYAVVTILFTNDPHFVDLSDGMISKYIKADTRILETVTLRNNENPNYIRFLDLEKKTDTHLNYDEIQNKYVVTDGNKGLLQDQIDKQFEAYSSLDNFKNIAGIGKLPIGYKLKIAFSPFTYISLISNRMVMFVPFERTIISEFNHDGLISKNMVKDYGTGIYRTVQYSYDFLNATKQMNIYDEDGNFKKMTLNDILEKYKDMLIIEK